MQFIGPVYSPSGSTHKPGIGKDIYNTSAMLQVPGEFKGDQVASAPFKDASSHRLPSLSCIILPVDITQHLHTGLFTAGGLSYLSISQNYVVAAWEPCWEALKKQDSKH